MDLNPQRERAQVTWRPDTTENNWKCWKILIKIFSTVWIRFHFQNWTLLKWSDKGVLSFAQNIVFKIYEMINRFLPNYPNCGWWGWWGKKLKPLVLPFINTLFPRTIILFIVRSWNCESPVLYVYGVRVFICCLKLVIIICICNLL